MTIANGNPAITIGNTIYYQHQLRDFTQSSDGIRSLVHELKHVVQYQRYGVAAVFARITRDYFKYGEQGAYQYYNQGNMPYNNRPLEAQAQIAGDYARYRETGQLPTYNIGGRQQEITRRQLEAYARGSGVYGR